MRSLYCIYTHQQTHEHDPNCDEFLASDVEICEKPMDLAALQKGTKETRPLHAGSRSIRQPRGRTAMIIYDICPERYMMC